MALGKELSPKLRGENKDDLQESYKSPPFHRLLQSNHIQEVQGPILSSDIFQLH